MRLTKGLLVVLVFTPFLLTGCKDEVACDSSKFDCTPIENKVDTSINKSTNKLADSLENSSSEVTPAKPLDLKEPQAKLNESKPKKSIEEVAYDALSANIGKYYKAHLAKETDDLFSYVGFYDMKHTSQSADALDFTYTIEMMRAGNPSDISQCELNGWYDTNSKQFGFEDVPENCLLSMKD